MYDKVDIRKVLDDVFETSGLLYVSNHFEKMKEETISNLAELGHEGKMFYEENFGAYEQYVSEFNKFKVITEYYDFFFDEYDLKFYMLILSMVIENRSLFVSFDKIDDKDISTQMLRYYSDIYEEELEITEIKSQTDIRVFLDGCKANNSTKWKMLCILQESKKYYYEYVNLLNLNQGSYNKSLKKIKNKLEELLDEFNRRMEKKEDGHFFKLLDSLSSGLSVSPMLVFPTSQVLFQRYTYYGVLNERTLKKGEDKKNTKERLLLKLKALGDQSKFDILMSLKDSSKYNLEMAEELKLSPSTMSHHMNVLLSCELVGINKEKGRVYYYLEKDNMNKTIRQLINFFDLDGAE